MSRYHGVFASNHRGQKQVTPARRGRRKAETADQPARARHVSMTWAQRLKRVFGVKMDTLMRMQSSYDIVQTRKREKEIRIRRVRRIGEVHPG